MEKPFILDFFSGCGGFALGAELAGFKTALAIDVEEVLQSSYKLNFPETNAILRDISAIEVDEINKLIGYKRPDGIIGGPPCQGFSRMGKRDEEDPRNSLIGHYFRLVKGLKPKFFVMENVEGLLDEGTVDVLMTELQAIKATYTVLDPMIINAANFGAPTNRKRVVVVGYDATAVDELSVADFMDTSVKRKTSVRSAIQDLPAPEKGSERPKDFRWVEYPDVTPFRVSEYAKKMRKAPPKGLGWTEAINKLSEGLITGLQDTIHTKKVATRYKNTPQGSPDKISKSHKLKWTGQCPTLRAGTGSEKGSFQAVRPLHPDEGRVITVREAARLQGFPDWFVFHFTKHHSFRMIGNSVSPIVSKMLLSTIKRKIHLKKVA